MNRMTRAFALPILAAALTCLPTVAQDHPDQDHHDQAQPQDRHDNGTYRQHDEWKKGARIPQEDWNRGISLTIKRTTCGDRPRVTSGGR